MSTCTICRHMRRNTTPLRQGFIRKHVFSLDHKVIGKQYYALALVAVFVGMVLSWLMRIHLGWTNAGDPRTAVAFQDRRPRRRDDAGVLPATDDHARHDHGLLCADDRAVRGLRQLSFCPSRSAPRTCPFRAST